MRGSLQRVVEVTIVTRIGGGMRAGEREQMPPVALLRVALRELGEVPDEAFGATVTPRRVVGMVGDRTGQPENVEEVVRLVGVHLHRRG